MSYIFAFKMKILNSIFLLIFQGESRTREAGSQRIIRDHSRHGGHIAHQKQKDFSAEICALLHGLVPKSSISKY